MSGLPKRSRRFGVGKEIGGAVYVHRMYEHVLPAAVAHAKLQIPAGFDYTVIKYVVKDETVSFIACVEFDATDEPSVGEVVTVKADGATSSRSASFDPWIYHHKWLFVADNYSGFDVAASKARSKQWLALDEIDFRRIGKKSFWEQNVVRRFQNAERLDDRVTEP